MGLPMYVAFDRKPEDGCEIQNVCCGKCGIMMQLRLVKSQAAMQAIAQAAAQEAEATGAVDDDNGYVCDGWLLLKFLRSFIAVLLTG